MKYKILCILIMILFIPISTANEVVFLGEGGVGKIVFRGEQPLKIGGYSIELHYPPSNTIESVNNHSLFYIVDYIDNSGGVTEIEAFALKDYDEDTDILLFTFAYSGNQKFDIVVRNIFDWNVELIDCKNFVPNPLIPIEEPELSEYSVTPRYVSPGIDSPSEAIKYPNQLSDQNHLSPLVTSQTVKSVKSTQITEITQDNEVEMMNNNLGESFIYINEKSELTDGVDESNFIPVESSPFPLEIALISIVTGIYLYFKRDTDSK